METREVEQQQEKMSRLSRKSAAIFIMKSVSEFNEKKRIDEEKENMKKEMNETMRQRLIVKKLYDLEKRVFFQDQRIRDLERELAIAQNKSNDNNNKLSELSEEQRMFIVDVEEAFQTFDKQMSEKVCPEISEQGLRINKLFEDRAKLQEALQLLSQAKP